MKSKFALSLLAACSLSLLPGMTYAHGNGQGEERADSDKVRTIKGCLERQGDEYQVRTEDGSTWEIKGEGMNLENHVGEAVKVTGTVDHAKMHGAKERAKDKTGNDSPEHGHMTVTNLKSIGRSCGK